MRIANAGINGIIKTAKKPKTSTSMYVFRINVSVCAVVSHNGGSKKSYGVTSPEI